MNETLTRSLENPHSRDEKYEPYEDASEYQRGYKLVNFENTDRSMAATTPLPNLRPTEGKQYTKTLNLNKLQALANKATDFPIRTQFRQKTTDVVTNHFEVQIDPKTTFYEYKTCGR